MRFSNWRYLAAISLFAAASALPAALRPRYGGTIQVRMRASVQSLEPDAHPQDRSLSAAQRNLGRLVLEQLVRLDGTGKPEPSLALSWQSDSSQKVWRFRIRPGVRFHDGSTLSASTVALVLRAANPEWRVSSAGSTVAIRSTAPAPGLPVVLSAYRYSIFRKAGGGGLLGTGPFRIGEWDPGRRAVLAANEDYWGGRPFADEIAVEMNRPLREQLLELELGKADIVEVSPGDARQAAQRGAVIWSSRPSELMALVFRTGRPASGQAALREALALSVDRAAIETVLLQKRGEAAGSLLPQWLSGYAFLFHPIRDVARARQLVSSLPPAARALSLGYEGPDPLARMVADRIAVNAREAGIHLRVSPEEAQPDLRLVRVRIEWKTPAMVMADLVSRLGLTSPQIAAPVPPEELYRLEESILKGSQTIPLFHLPVLYGVGARVRTWSTEGVGKTGALLLEDIWLEAGTPRASGYASFSWSRSL